MLNSYLTVPNLLYQLLKFGKITAFSFLLLVISNLNTAFVQNTTTPGDIYILLLTKKENDKSASYVFQKMNYARQQLESIIN